MATQATISKEAADRAGTAESTRAGRYYRPNVDILERPDELLVLADIPGTKADRVDIRFEDGALSIHAKVDPRQDSATEYLLYEYGIGDYYRSFRMSEAIDASKISAEYNDGILTLHLPKSEAVKPRRIKVAAR
jgi:HSP20 family protein